MNHGKTLLHLICTAPPDAAASFFLRCILTNENTTTVGMMASCLLYTSCIYAKAVETGERYIALQGCYEK